MVARLSVWVNAVRHASISNMVYNPSMTTIRRVGISLIKRGRIHRRYLSLNRLGESDGTNERQSRDRQVHRTSSGSNNGHVHARDRPLHRAGRAVRY